MTEEEALTLGNLDLEIRNALQAIKILELETELARRVLQQLQNERELEKQKNISLVGKLRPRYEQYIKNLAKRYKISDPKNLVFDPDTRIIRDATS